MAELTTSDGFEFETFRTEDSVRCVCRRDGKESSVTVTYGPSVSPDTLHTELLELVARNAWLAGDRMGRRETRRGQ